MRPRLIAIFLLIVLTPIGLLAWLGVRVARNEQEIVHREFQELLDGRLKDTRAVIARLIQERERDLLRITDLRATDAATIRELVRKNPTISQIFVLGADGKRLHPPAEGPFTSSEVEFLQRAGQVWRDKGVFYRPSEEAASATTRGEPLREKTPPAGQGQGWYVWYWDNGIHLVFWRRTTSALVVGVELDRARLLADMVGELPDTDPLDPHPSDGLIRLVDSDGATLYQWGGYQPPKDGAPAAASALEYPLNSWGLRYFTSAGEVGGSLGRGVAFNLISGLLAATIALVGLGAYFYRESSREFREAAQRVSFVNQVSHELKTPLTNIRMYAELLEQHVGDDDPKAAQFLDIVVSECRRLSRLISNVLTFSRRQRDKLTLRMAVGNVDDLIRSVIESFRLSMEAKGVKVEFSAGAGKAVQFDADAVEQILGNLFSNVEKYAASGGEMKVASRQEGDRTVVTVSDRGPGIPADQRHRIFEPFYRLSNQVSDGVTGTGIGLAIARDLARRHGGDLTLVPAPEGACFELVLRTPTDGNKGEP